ncbi:protein Turandot X [Drosophila elegans]|uniref:protein Turandot X n=1 Tax=Drosophila elegans TaxID=30023 RepID=UPI0007E8173A|nr:protein Turandot X [Drosophila elegans]
MRVYFSSLLTVIVSFICSANAEINGSQYEANRRLILVIFHNSSVNNPTREEHLSELVAFYRRYPNDVPVTNADKQQFERFIREYDKYRKVLIYGVPPQGGVIGSIFVNFLGRVGFRYVGSLFNKKKENEKRRGTNSTELPFRFQNINENGSQLRTLNKEKHSKD